MPAPHPLYHQLAEPGQLTFIISRDGEGATALAVYCVNAAINASRRGEYGFVPAGGDPGEDTTAVVLSAKYADRWRDRLDNAGRNISPQMPPMVKIAPPAATGHAQVVAVEEPGKIIEAMDDIEVTPDLLVLDYLSDYSGHNVEKLRSWCNRGAAVIVIAAAGSGRGEERFARLSAAADVVVEIRGKGASFKHHGERHTLTLAMDGIDGLPIMRAPVGVNVEDNRDLIELQIAALDAVEDSPLSPQQLVDRLSRDGWSAMATTEAVGRLLRKQGVLPQALVLERGGRNFNANMVEGFGQTSTNAATIRRNALQQRLQPRQGGSARSENGTYWSKHDQAMAAARRSG